MKEGRLLIRGVPRMVYEDQVEAAVKAMRSSAAVSQNDKVLLGAIVDAWSARGLSDPLETAKAHVAREMP